MYVRSDAALPRLDLTQRGIIKWRSLLQSSSEESSVVRMKLWLTPELGTVLTSSQSCLLAKQLEDMSGSHTNIKFLKNSKQNSPHP